ncbi:MAG TPA: hypothetical protein PLD25_30780 [Chloroflexota bacterium]|nr:hypothetical protein [Chloroflexota bacterium]
MSKRPYSPQARPSPTPTTANKTAVTPFTPPSAYPLPLRCPAKQNGRIPSTPYSHSPSLLTAVASPACAKQNGRTPSRHGSAHHYSHQLMIAGGLTQLTCPSVLVARN